MKELDLDLNKIILEFKKTKTSELFKNKQKFPTKWSKKCKSFNNDDTLYIYVGCTIYRII